MSSRGPDFGVVHPIHQHVINEILSLVEIHFLRDITRPELRVSVAVSKLDVAFSSRIQVCIKTLSVYAPVGSSKLYAL
jgi:hypothetical protein